MSAPAPDRRGLQTAAIVVVFVAACAVLVAAWSSLTPSSAAFSDRELVAGNRLGAGELDVAVGGGTTTLSARDLAPGDEADGRIEIVNGGTLALRYELAAFASQDPLREELEVVAWDGAPDGCAAPPSGAPTWRPLLDPPGLVGSPASGRLAPGTSQLVCLRAELPLSAPSAVSGRRLDLVIGIDAAHDLPLDDGSAT